MTVNFDFLPDRRITESAKWRSYHPDILPMWIADMDFLSPEPVIQALCARARHGVFGYPEEMPDLIQGIIDWSARHYGWSVKPEEIVLLPGVVTGFNLACQAVAVQGEAALVQTPVYPPFLTAPDHARLQRQENLLERDADGDYQVNFEAFEAAITPQTRIFILCNPHNPVGRVFRRDELERIAELCLKHDVIICSDEIHCDLVYQGHRHIPIAALDPEVARQTITLMAPSKTFNIAGLGCSFAVIPDSQLRQKFNHARRGLVNGVNALAQVAAVAAYREGESWLEQLLQYLQQNRDLLYDCVNRELPGISMGRPEGTYLAWLDCRQSGILDLQENGIEGNPYRFFMEKARVAFNDGEYFGRGGEGFVRLNFGCPRALLVEALERMKEALKCIPGKSNPAADVRRQEGELAASF